MYDECTQVKKNRLTRGMLYLDCWFPGAAVRVSAALYVCKQSNKNIRTEK